MRSASSSGVGAITVDATLSPLPASPPHNRSASLSLSLPSCAATAAPQAPPKAPVRCTEGGHPPCARIRAPGNGGCDLATVCGGPSGGGLIRKGATCWECPACPKGAWWACDACAGPGPAGDACPAGYADADGTGAREASGVADDSTLASALAFAPDSDSDSDDSDDSCQDSDGEDEGDEGDVDQPRADATLLQLLVDFAVLTADQQAAQQAAFSVHSTTRRLRREHRGSSAARLQVSIYILRSTS